MALWLHQWHCSSPTHLLTLCNYTNYCWGLTTARCLGMLSRLSCSTIPPNTVATGVEVFCGWYVSSALSFMTSQLPRATISLLSACRRSPSPISRHQILTRQQCANTGSPGGSGGLETGKFPGGPLRFRVRLGPTIVRVSHCITQNWFYLAYLSVVRKL